jgi:hypothetical protein
MAANVTTNAHLTPTTQGAIKQVIVALLLLPVGSMLRSPVIRLSYLAVRLRPYVNSSRRTGKCPYPFDYKRVNLTPPRL